MADVPVRNVVAGKVTGNVVQVGSATLVPPEARPIAVAGLPPLGVFVGREVELARLTAALRPRPSRPGEPESVLVWSIGGLAGVGKTALAVSAAHLAVAAGHFPGGVVMTNLRGYDDPHLQVTASTALAGLLSAIGVASGHVPPGEEDRARLWRSIVADRERMLILVDNVSDPNHVRPLLPGGGDHQVLITSRHRLAGLDHARLLDLDLLDEDDATHMLTAVLRIGDPDDTRATDVAACARVARLCGWLPLALRVAAALLVAEPERSMSDLADALADERNRLRELHYDSSLAVRAAFDLSYTQLSVEQARLLRLAALDPGPDVSTEALAALTDVDRATALREIRALRAAHLLQPAQRAGRWRMHDLVKLYASEKVATDPERRSALARLLDHYLAFMRDANTPANTLRLQDKIPEKVDDERANLVAVIDLAHSEGLFDQLVELAVAVSDYLGFRRLWVERIASLDLALSAVHRRGDAAVEADLLAQLGYSHLWLASFDVAMNAFRRSMRLYRVLGNRASFGYVLNRLGEAYRETGRLEWAMACHRWAHDLLRVSGNTEWHISALANMSFIYRKQRKFAEAARLQEAVLPLCRQLASPLLEGRAMNQLGITYRELGRFDEAIRHHSYNLRVVETTSDYHGYAGTMASLATTHRAAGNLDDAVRCGLEAARVLRSLGMRQDLAVVLRELALTYRALGRGDEARQCSREAERVIEPGGPVGYLKVGHTV